MSYGYAYLTPHGESSDQDIPITQRSAAEIRGLMCAKSHGDVSECGRCPGFSTCIPGQRMAAIMQRTQYQQVWKAEEQEKPKPAGMKTEDERQLFRTACESGNAWHYLMETFSMTKEAAGDLLQRLIRKNPGIAAEYGGGRRIAQRPRVVNITRVGGQEDQPQPEPQETQQLPQEAPPQAQAEPPEDGKAERQPRPPRSEKEAQTYLDRSAKARQRCADAVASGDPEAWLAATGIKPHSVLTTMVDWSRKYPDLMQGFQRQTVSIGDRKQRARELYEICMASDDPIACYMQRRGVKKDSAKVAFQSWEKSYGWPAPKDGPKPQPDKQPEPPQEDLMNLSDFLAQFDAPDQAPPETAQNAAENAPEETGGELLAQSTEGPLYGEIDRENGGFVAEAADGRQDREISLDYFTATALYTLTDIMRAGAGTVSEKIRAAEIVLTYMGGIRS